MFGKQRGAIHALEYDTGCTVVNRVTKYKFVVFRTYLNFIIIANNFFKDSYYSSFAILCFILHDHGYF